MIAYCGLICTDCSAYKATRAMSDEQAKQVASQWSQTFHVDIKVADVWCDGCLVEGKKCVHCGECEIRACARNLKVENCGLCDQYACGKLQGFFQMAPAARDVLDAQRAAKRPIHPGH
jgi:hypothetical protein